MHESNWFSSTGFEHLTGQQFIDGSFFKTLIQRHLIEITGSSQVLVPLACGNLQWITALTRLNGVL